MAKSKRAPISLSSVHTKRGEARVEKTGIAAGQPFGINKATRRLAAKA